MMKNSRPVHAVVLTVPLILALVLAVTTTWATVPSGPPSFTDPLNITNAFQPFQPGGSKIFTGSKEGARTIVLDLYLTETRAFQLHGRTVQCRILREIAFEDGQLVEVADNFFAQGDDGAVYYFGEVVDNYEGGVVANHDGSWLVGGPTLPSDPSTTGVATDPAVFMPADPQVGDVFKPEDLFPIVDESAEVVATGKTVRVPAGRYKGVIVIKESSRLSTGTERKWYAPGVGVVQVRALNEVLQLEASTLVQSK